MKNIAIIIASCILFLATSLKAQELVSPTSTLTPKTDSLRKVKEFGIGFTSLTAYSLQYRWGNTKRLFRVNATISGSTAFGKTSSSSSYVQDTINSNSNISTGKTKTPLNFNTSLGFSMLYLKNIAKKFGLMYGPTAGISYLTSTSQTNSTGTYTSYYYNNSPPTTTTPNTDLTKSHSETLQPYVGFVLGAFYKINKSFLLYAEIAPNIYYANTKTNTTNNTQYPGSSITIDDRSTTNYNNTFGLANLSNSGATITIVYRITGK